MPRGFAEGPCAALLRVFLLLYLTIPLPKASAATSEEKSQDDFARRYQAYQQHVSEGQASIASGNNATAIESYTRALAISPFVAAHYYDRGRALYREGRIDEALEDFRRCILLDPGWTPAYVYRGLCWVHKADYAQALADYNTALAVTPQDPTLHNNFAWLYATARDEKFRDKGKALEHARKAAELSHGTNAEILDTLAEAYFVSGNVNEALETITRALKLEPGNKRFEEKLRTYTQHLDAKGGKNNAN